MKKKRIGQDVMDKEKRVAFAGFSLLAAAALFMILYRNDIGDILRSIKYQLGF